MPGEKPVERMPRAVGREVHHVVCDSDGRPGSFLAQDGGRLGVGREEVVERARGGARVGESGRDLAVEEAAEKKYERLVERDVEPHGRGGGARRERTPRPTRARSRASPGETTSGACSGGA